MLAGVLSIELRTYSPTTLNPSYAERFKIASIHTINDTQPSKLPQNYPIDFGEKLQEDHFLLDFWVGGS